MQEGIQERLRWGLIPAVPVPFDASGAIHMPAQEAYAGWMAGQPVAGVAIWAHTGRGLLMNDEQRTTILGSWRSALADKLIICGVGSRATDPQQHRDESLRMAETALKGGADALMAYAPTLYRNVPDRDEQIVAYHRALASLGAPLVLFYLYEAAGGIMYTPAVLRELFSLPNVAGIKMATLDSVVTYQDVAALIRDEFPHVLLITGEDRFLGYSIQLGAQAALIGMGSARTRLQADLLKAWAAQDATRFLELGAAADQLGMATFIQPMEGYIQRMLWLLAEDGIIPPDAIHDPWGPRLSANERRAVIAATENVGRENVPAV